MQTMPTKSWRNRPEAGEAAAEPLADDIFMILLAQNQTSGLKIKIL
jgi:hypothetical protein